MDCKRQRLYEAENKKKNPISFVSQLSPRAALASSGSAISFFSPGSSSPSPASLLVPKLLVRTFTRTFKILLYRMWCQSCQEEYKENDVGTRRENYKEASEMEEEHKREIENLKANVFFLRLHPLVDRHLPNVNVDMLLHGLSESHDEARPDPLYDPHKQALSSKPCWGPRWKTAT
ncbi:BTB/POZ domain-containing protein [Dendrobium catenatum]|uniref:BTB/POZ domain-containing protein n=1 Tax=Dendrobium catenatum TaxID=906689 RepID=A0A2I0X5J9_9ASPA|nr:BTB/POZ domain-containing protein [Dendrobium catenatum]